MTRRAAILWSVALWGACLDLEELDLERCGNAVLEGGEDCDTYAQAPGGEVCIAVGQPGQCRYSCAAGEEGVPLACPGGYGCGVDGICRRHSGQNDVVVATGQLPGNWIGTGDVDGDGSDDVVNLLATQLTVDFIEEGAYRETYRLPLEARGLPLVEHFDNDSLADVAIPTELGLAVWRGSSTRTLLPTTYASLPLEIEAYEFVAVDVVPDIPLVPLDPPVLFPGDEPLALTTFGAFALRRQPTYGVAFGAIEDAQSFPVAAAAGHVIAARFDETVDVHGEYVESPEQIALAVGSPAEIYVYRPSYFVQDKGDGARVYYFVNAPSEAVPSDDPPVPVTHPPFTTISAPGNATLVGGPIATHANAEGATPTESNIPCGGSTWAIADTHLDLVIAAQIGDDPTTLVAFGTGDGNFHSDPCQLDEVAALSITADNGAATPPLWTGCDETLLAAGDIDGDRLIDFVTPTAVRLSGRIPTALVDAFGICDGLTGVPHPDEDGDWTEAAIGDFNGDGRRDVVAANQAGAIDFLTSAEGSTLNHARIGTSGQASLLTVGDFDGSGVEDVTYAELREGAVDFFYAIFGDLGALPATPVLVGGLPEIVRVTVMDLAEAESPAVDSISDIGLGTKDTVDDIGFRFALLYGRADRQLQAPFIYATDPTATDPATERYTPVGVTVAPFGLGCSGGEDPGRALIMSGIARREFPTPPPTPPETVLGAACIRDDATLDPIEANEFDLVLDKERVKSSAAAAVRLSGDAPEPVFITWRNDFADGDVGMDIGAPRTMGEGDALTWDTGQLATVADAVPAHATGPDPGSRLWRWSGLLSNTGLACRFTAEGPESLVLLAVHLDGECGSGEARARTILHVLPAATLLGIRDGGSLEGAEELTGSDEQMIMGFACLNADEDPAEELAFVTLDGPDEQCDVESTARARTATVHIVQADANGKLELTASSFVVLDGTQLASLEQPLGVTPPVSGMARGDFNGDGVHDLVVAAFPSSLLLLGRPVNR